MSMRIPNSAVRLILYNHETKELSEIKLEAQERETPFYYDTMYMEQKRANTCSDTSQAMIDHFHSEPIPALQKNPRKPFQHRPDEELLKSGFHQLNDLTTSNIAGTLKYEGPILINMPMRFNSEHSVVCIGCTDKYLILHDPLDSGNIAISKDDYVKINNNSSLIEAFSKDIVYKAYYRGEIELKAEEMKNQSEYKVPAYIIHKNGVIYIDANNHAQDIPIDKKLLLDQDGNFKPHEFAKHLLILDTSKTDPIPLSSGVLRNLNMLAPEWNGPYKDKLVVINESVLKNAKRPEPFTPHKSVAKHFNLLTKDNPCGPVIAFLKEYSKELKGEPKQAVDEFVAKHKDNKDIKELMGALKTELSGIRKELKEKGVLSDIKTLTGMKK
jgi:hypothetical protein